MYVRYGYVKDNTYHSYSAIQFPHPELAVDSVMPSDIQDLIMQAGSIMSDTLRASIMGGLAELVSEMLIFRT